MDPSPDHSPPRILTGGVDPSGAPVVEVTTTKSASYVPNLTTLSLVDPTFVPASTITNPHDGFHTHNRGAPNLQYFERLKREQNAKLVADIPPATVYWDEKNPSDLLAVLESCGTQPTLYQERVYNTQMRKRFDPSAPHFDVIIVDMVQSDYLNPNYLYGKQSRPTPENEQYYSTNGPNRIVESFDGIAPNKSELGGPRSSSLDDLPLESLAGRPGWLFLQVGSSTAGLLEGRRLLKKWGFKRIESIAWMPTESQWIVPAGEGLFRKAVEWCLVGIKGSAKRTFDRDIVHCNSYPDVIVSRDRPNMCALAESFSQGLRRLHIFGRADDVRRGWVTVGKDLKTDNFDCRKFCTRWQERESWLVPYDDEIESFRPKTPVKATREKVRLEMRKTLRYKTDMIKEGMGWGCGVFYPGHAVDLNAKWKEIACLEADMSRVGPEDEQDMMGLLPSDVMAEISDPSTPANSSEGVSRQSPDQSSDATEWPREEMATAMVVCGHAGQAADSPHRIQGDRAQHQSVPAGPVSPADGTPASESGIFTLEFSSEAQISIDFSSREPPAAALQSGHTIVDSAYPTMPPPDARFQPGPMHSRGPSPYEVTPGHSSALPQNYALASGPLQELPHARIVNQSDRRTCPGLQQPPPRSARDIQTEPDQEGGSGKARARPHWPADGAEGARLRGGSTPRDGGGSTPRDDSGSTPRDDSAEPLIQGLPAECPYVQVAEERRPFMYGDEALTTPISSPPVQHEFWTKPGDHPRSAPPPGEEFNYHEMVRQYRRAAALAASATNRSAPQNNGGVFNAPNGGVFVSHAQFHLVPGPVSHGYSGGYAQVSNGIQHSHTAPQNLALVIVPGTPPSVPYHHGHGYTGTMGASYPVDYHRRSETQTPIFTGNYYRPLEPLNPSARQAGGEHGMPRPGNYMHNQHHVAVYGSHPPPVNTPTSYSQPGMLTYSQPHAPHTYGSPSPMPYESSIPHSASDPIGFAHYRPPHRGSRQHDGYPHSHTHMPPYMGYPAPPGLHGYHH